MRFTRNLGISQLQADLLCYSLLFAWFGYIASIQFWAYRSGIMLGDIHLFANGLHATGRAEHVLYFADYEVKRGFTTLLQDHFEPTLLVLWPIVRLFGTESLLVVGAFAPLVPVLYLYHALRRSLPDIPWLPVVAVLAFATNPRFAHATVDILGGFYPESLLLILIPPALHLFLRRRWAWFTLLFLLCLGVKENAGFIWAAFGAYTAVFDRQRRVAGAVVAVASVCAFGFAVFIFPYLYGTVNIYADAAQALFDPDIAATWDTMEDEWLVVWLVMWPAWLSPGYVLATLPDIFMYSLNRMPAGLHYALPVFAMLYFAAAESTPRIVGLARQSARWRLLFGAALIAQVGAAALHLDEPLKILRKHYSLGLHDAAAPTDRADVRALIDGLDLRCGVAAEMPLLRHVNDLPWLYATSGSGSEHVATHWLTVPTREPEYFGWKSLHRQAEKDPRFEVVREQGGITLWRNPAAPCPRAR